MIHPKELTQLWLLEARRLEDAAKQIDISDEEANLNQFVAGRLRKCISQMDELIWQEYQRGLDDSIKAIRLGRDDWSSGEDIGKIINWILDVAEGRISDLKLAQQEPHHD